MKFERFLALEASAGSGKTFALSVRYVALILMGAKISEILAITFTNKAASEMKTRIIDTFLNLEFKENELKEICAQLDKTRDEVLNLRNEKKAEFLQSELKIRTFDSFFATIVRSFSLNLGLMSDFEINENELDANAKFTQLLSENELENLAKYILNTQNQKGFFEDLEFLYENAYATPSDNAPFPANELKIANEIYQNFKNFALNLSENKNYQKNFVIENLDKDSLKELIEKPIICDFPNKQYFEKALENSEFLSKRQNLLDALNAYANALEKYKLAHLMHFLSIFKAAKNAVIKEQNHLSFGDVAKKAHELLSQNELKDMIYFRLDGFVAHLLIDEFQDTSVLQYQILKPLIAEIVAGQGTREFKSFFYVGDKKQSIYRFRHGKKELFDQLQRDFPQIKCDNLPFNYRSGENLVEFVNKNFLKIYPQNYYKEQKAIKDGGFVKIVEVNDPQSSKEDDETKSEKVFNNTYNALLEQLNFLKANGVSEDEICILCWANKDNDNIVERLRNDGFNAYTQSNIILKNKGIVCALLSYAKYCIFGDEFYIELVKSLLGIEFKKKCLNLNANPAKILHDLAIDLGLDLSDAALIQLLQLAAQKENLLEILFDEPSETLANAKNLGICVMTVHKSKGLEFKHLIVIDTLLVKPVSDADKILLEYDVNNAAWEIHAKCDIRKNTQEAKYGEFLEKIEKLDGDEHKNKLYVALTRAKSSLFIIKRKIKETLALKSYFKDFECGECGEFKNANESDKEQEIYTQTELLPFKEIPRQKTEPTKIEQNTEEIAIGNAFHNFMEQLNLNNEGNFESVKTQISHSFHHILSKNQLNDVFSRVKNLLANAEFKALLSGKKLLKEQNIAYENERKTLDLLAINDNEAVIIDYKTGERDKEGHEKQVKFYKNAIQNINATKRPNTRAFIVYALQNEIKMREV